MSSKILLHMSLFGHISGVWLGTAMLVSCLVHTEISQQLLDRLSWNLVHSAQRMICNDFGDPLTFHITPPAGLTKYLQNWHPLSFSCTLYLVKMNKCAIYWLSWIIFTYFIYLTTKTTYQQPLGCVRAICRCFVPLLNCWATSYATAQRILWQQLVPVCPLARALSDLIGWLLWQALCWLCVCEGPSSGTSCLVSSLCPHTRTHILPSHIAIQKETCPWYIHLHM